MKIALVVHGRFHAFDLLRALLKRGNDVTMYTNYPRWAVAKFGLPADRVHTFPLHGILSRVAARLLEKAGLSADRWLHPIFSRWAAGSIAGTQCDVIHAWTGVAEEIYSVESLAGKCKLVMRGSAHIRRQAVLLAEERARVGHRIDQPSEWMIGREEREYALADKIVVLSTFAYDSFIAEGIPGSKLRFLPLGTETGAFRPRPEAVETRRARILSGAPLRVLYVGGICYRKGLIDLREIVEKSAGKFKFRFVGPVWSEARSTVAELAGQVEFVPKRPQSELPKEYEWGDLFLFPTVEDGYAAVLAQAGAGALPILTTANCAGPDMLREGSTGWILPIRDPQAFIDRLNWCDTHRTELADMVTAAYAEFQTRDWSDVAADFEALCEAAVQEKREEVLRRAPVESIR